MKTIIGFKFIRDDMTSENGNQKWEIGKWYSMPKNKLELCEKGFHACLTPQQSLNFIYGHKWFQIEAKGKIIFSDENDLEPKFVASEMRLVKEIKQGEEQEILKKYKKPLDLTRLENDLKDIPTKDDVIKIIKEIDKIEWFKPQEPNKLKIKLVVDSILKAFKIDFQVELQLNPLNKKEDWASVRDSAWASAWDSAWDSARASARASVFELVKDLMKEKGYDKNPFKELLKLWEMGLYPVGILKDKKFHIYYVPKKK